MIVWRCSRRGCRTAHAFRGGIALCPHAEKMIGHPYTEVPAPRGDVIPHGAGKLCSLCRSRAPSPELDPVDAFIGRVVGSKTLVGLLVKVTKLEQDFVHFTARHPYGPVVGLTVHRVRENSALSENESILAAGDVAWRLREKTRKRQGTTAGAAG